jgi:hypothetical protein
MIAEIDRKQNKWAKVGLSHDKVNKAKSSLIAGGPFNKPLKYIPRADIHLEIYKNQLV